MTRRLYPTPHNQRNPGYRGPLPPALEPLRPFCVEHDDTIRSLLAAQAAIKSVIDALELQHEALNEKLCAYAEAKLKMR